MKSRTFLLIVSLLILALFGISQLKEVTDDVVFPAKYAISLSGEEKQIDSKSVYSMLSENSNENNRNLFRTFLNDQGNESQFAFLKTSENEKKFVTNLDLLANTSFEGTYYADALFSNELLNELKESGVMIDSVELQWYLVGMSFWSDGIRAIGLWSLTLSIFFAYFSLLYLHRKNSYVARLLGKSRQVVVRSTSIDSLTILGTSVCIFFLFSIANKGTLLSMESLSFLSILSVNTVVLLCVVMVARLLFYQLTKYGNILAVLKGINTPIIVSIIWFIGIVSTLLIIPLVLNQITSEDKILNQQLDSLRPWKYLEDYRSLTVTFPSDYSGQTQNGLIDTSGDLAYGKKFMSYFKENQYIFSEKSQAIIPEQVSQEQKNELLTDYRKDGINPEVTKNISYMNKHAYELSNKVFDTKGIKESQDAPATIYIPNQYTTNIDSVVNATYMEFFQESNVSRESFETIVIPDGLQTFLFDYRGVDLTKFKQGRMQSTKDEIVVVLNMNDVLAAPSAITAYSNSTNGLFLSEALAVVSTDSLVTKNLSNIVSPYHSIKLKMNRLSDRINSAKTAVIVLIIVQFIVLLQFVLRILKQNLKEVSVKRLLGVNINRIILATFNYYLLLLVFTLLLAFSITENTAVKYLLLSGSLVELLGIFVFLRKVISKKTNDFLKGDVEI